MNEGRCSGVFIDGDVDWAGIGFVVIVQLRHCNGLSTPWHCLFSGIVRCGMSHKAFQLVFAGLLAPFPCLQHGRQLLELGIDPFLNSCVTRACVSDLTRPHFKSFTESSPDPLSCGQLDEAIQGLAPLNSWSFPGLHQPNRPVPSGHNCHCERRPC